MCWSPVQTKAARIAQTAMTNPVMRKQPAALDIVKWKKMLMKRRKLAKEKAVMIRRARSERVTH